MVKLFLEVVLVAIKNKLLEIRLNNGYKYAKKFSDYLEINNQQYSRYESNKKQPNLEILYKISKKLGIKIEDIIYFEEDQLKN
nr:MULTISPECIES: helix-turn-helix transcriptional regulator [unclassified Clostridium]